MSKASLKKEIASFTNEQLVELVLNIYDSSKEAKAYLEFFLAPDGDKLLEKKIDAIAKEINRTKWGYSKGRISVIKKTIKELQAYGVEPELTARLYDATLQMLVGHYRYVNYTPALLQGVYTLAADFILFCQKHGMLTTATDALDAMLARPQYSTEGMKDTLRKTIANTLATIK